MYQQRQLQGHYFRNVPQLHANPQQVAEKLGDVYKEHPKPILFDAIKVSHHGSAHSTSKELVRIADSEHYFVTGGASARPSYQALARIVMAPLKKGMPYREIRYNRGNDVLNSLDNQESLKKKFHYSIVGNKNEYEVSY
jgi:argininosuccinate lyase